MSRDKSGRRHSKRTRGFLSEDSEDDREGDADPEGNDYPDFQADSEERDSEDSEVEEDYGAEEDYEVEDYEINACPENEGISELRANVSHHRTDDKNSSFDDFDRDYRLDADDI